MITHTHRVTWSDFILLAQMSTSYVSPNTKAGLRMTKFQQVSTFIQYDSVYNNHIALKWP